MKNRWLLNGYWKAGCHQSTCFSTYHNIVDGRCEWCNRSEVELVNLGAEWIDVMGNKRPKAVEGATHG
jgi:hypothetical protein